MKSETEIQERIVELDERYRNFSERSRMSGAGLSIVMRIHELQWVLEP